MSKPGSFTDFNSLLDKATNPMQLEPDTESVKKICLLIDKDVVEASYAIQALYGKMTDDNPHTVLFALRVLEKIFYECGNLAHRVICTEIFMNLLKDIIETTQQKLIRDKILELVQTWTDTFKHLPQYCAPEKLLRSLQAEGYVFPGFEAKTLPCDKKASNHSTSKSITNGVSKQNECNNKDLGINFDADLKNREDCFMKSLRDIQEQKKRDFKRHQKSLGLPTSSDEEDNGNVSNEHEENWPKNYGLPAELRKVKQSRQAVDRELQEYRKLKNDEFKQKSTDENGASNKVLQLRNPADKCSTCEKYKKCSHDNVFERSTPRLHPDLKKVKESREIIKHSFEEVKNRKKQEFYASKSNDCIDIDNNRNWRYKNEDSLEIGNEESRNAIDISQEHANLTSLNRPKTKLEIQREEQDALDKAIQLSLLEIGPHSSLEDDDELQRAIDMSFAEAEEQHFSAAPKLENNEDDNVLLSYVTELSLDDSYEKECKLAELYAEYDVAEPCVICKNETLFLKTFKPCNHRCICDDCSKMYKSQVCPICRAYYSSIRFS